MLSGVGLDLRFPTRRVRRVPDPRGRFRTAPEAEASAHAPSHSPSSHHEFEEPGVEVFLAEVASTVPAEVAVLFVIVGACDPLVGRFEKVLLNDLERVGDLGRGERSKERWRESGEEGWGLG